MAKRGVQTSATEGLPRRQERRLIDQARKGSEDAVEALFRAYWARAYRAAQMVCRDPVAAEDIAQEAFLAAIRRLDRFDRRRPFGPWVHRIAVNRAIDWTRARALRAESGPAPLESLPARSDPGSGDDPREQGLAEAIGALSAEHRAVIAMRYVLEMSPGEIAAELGLPRGTVNSRLRRALDRLESTLQSGEVAG